MEGAMVVLHHARLASVACRRFMISSITAHGNISNVKKAMYARQGTQTNSNVSHIPHARMYMHVASPSDYQCRMTSALSLGTDPRLLIYP